MAISRFDNPAGLPPIDFDFLFKTKQYNDKVNKEAEEDAGALATKLSSVNALPQDKALRNQKLNQYDKRLNDWTTKYQNNMSAGLPELRAIKNDFSKDITRGQLGAIQSNYAARTEHEKEVDKAFYDGKINQQRRDALLNYDLDSYKGVGEENPESSYNSYLGTTPAKEMNPPKFVDDFLTGWKSTKVAQGGYKMDTQGKLYKDSFVNNKSVREYVTEEELKNQVSPILKDNPEIRSFIDQETKFATAGIDPNAVYQLTDPNGKPLQKTGKDLIDNYRESMYENAINFGVAKHSFLHKEDTQSDLSFLPEYLAGEKDAEGNFYLTNNLNSVNIPKTDKIKVNTGNLPGAPEGVYSGGTGGAGWSSWRTVPGYDQSGKKTQVTFTPEQEAIFQKSGKKAKNDYEKGKIINEGIDKFNQTLIFPGLKAYDFASKATADKAEREQKMFFGKDGPLLGTTRNYKLITGEGEKEYTASEFFGDYGDDKGYTKSVTGFLQPDNPYFPGGRIVTIKDNKTGEIVGTYAMSPSDQEAREPKGKIIHDMAQARYTPSGESSVKLTFDKKVENKTERVTEDYVVKFNTIPTDDPEVKIEIASLIDPKTGKEIATVENDGSTAQGTFDMLFKQLTK